MDNREYKRLVRIILVQGFIILLLVGFLVVFGTLKFKDLQREIAKLGVTHTNQQLQGIQGLQGMSGIQGIPGINGVNGVNGKDGVPGATGPIGATGATGAQGATGKQGKSGVTPTLCKLLDGTIGQIFPGDSDCVAIGD